MKAIHLVTALALLSFTTACGNTANGAKKDAENAAEKTKEAADAAADKTKDAANSTGMAVSGALQTTEVKAALVADSRIDASNINVDTDEAKKLLTLKGTVPSEAQKATAREIAAVKATGYTIVNELTIKTP
ncbi:MAG: BON domain-containing protein [Gemmatimonadaceae bacterium]